MLVIQYFISFLPTGLCMGYVVWLSVVVRFCNVDVLLNKLDIALNSRSLCTYHIVYYGESLSLVGIC